MCIPNLGRLLLELCFKMKKIYVFSILIFLGFAKIPDEKVLVDFYGDLTNDKIDERVIVTELDEEGEFGKIRLLQIFTKKSNKWIGTRFVLKCSGNIKMLFQELPFGISQTGEAGWIISLFVVGKIIPYYSTKN